MKLRFETSHWWKKVVNFPSMCLLAERWQNQILDDFRLIFWNVVVSVFGDNGAPRKIYFLKIQFMQHYACPPAELIQILLRHLWLFSSPLKVLDEISLCYSNFTQSCRWSWTTVGTTDILQNSEQLALSILPALGHRLPNSVRGKETSLSARFS